jgi:hypothetical protein
MGHPVDTDRKEPRIAENHLVVALRCGIPIIGSADIGSQNRSQPGELAHEIHGDLLPALLTSNTREIVANAVMAQSNRYLLGQDFKQPRGFLAEIIAQIELLDTTVDKIPRVENSADPFHNVHDGIPRRDRFRADVIETIVSITGKNQFIHDPGN